MKKAKLSSEYSYGTADRSRHRHHGLDTYVLTETDDVQSIKKNEGVIQKDPMKIKVILQRIFDFCCMETLKNCRLVSTNWLDDSMKAWRNKAELQLFLRSDAGTPHMDGNLNFREYLQLPESEEDDDNEDVKLRNLKTYPFKRFCFEVSQHLIVYSNEDLRKIAAHARFIRLVGYPSGDSEIVELTEFLVHFHSLKVLHFHNCFHISIEYDFEEEADFELPNLKRLIISQEMYNFTHGWVSLLNWFPNLEALTFEYEGINQGKCRYNVERALESLKTIRQSRGKRVMPLKALEIKFTVNKNEYAAESSIMDSAIARTISECNFPLERLTISLDWTNLLRLLESCKSTLVYLDACFSFHFDWNVCPLALDPGKSVHMEQLKEALLGKGHHRALCLLTHLKLPHLQKLTIEKDKHDKIPLPGNPQWSFPKGRVYKMLETLEFLDDTTMPASKTIETFAQVMPNLVHLTIPLNKTTFPIVCERFGGLKILNILGPEHRLDELDDESLTGVSKTRGEEGTRPPNITCLTQLTDFKISCESQLLGNDVKFTDHSVIHGFLQLPRLHSLSIAFRDLSENVKAKLLIHVKGNLDIQEMELDVDYYVVEMGDEYETGSHEAEEVFNVLGNDDGKNDVKD